MALSSEYMKHCLCKLVNCFSRPQLQSIQSIRQQGRPATAENSQSTLQQRLKSNKPRPPAFKRVRSQSICPGQKPKERPATAENGPATRQQWLKPVDQKMQAAKIHSPPSMVSKSRSLGLPSSRCKHSISVYRNQKQQRCRLVASSPASQFSALQNRKVHGASAPGAVCPWRPVTDYDWSLSPPSGGNRLHITCGVE